MLLLFHKGARLCGQARTMAFEYKYSAKNPSVGDDGQALSRPIVVVVVA